MLVQINEFEFFLLAAIQGIMHRKGVTNALWPTRTSIMEGQVEANRTGIPNAVEVARISPNSVARSCDSTIHILASLPARWGSFTPFEQVHGSQSMIG